MRSRRILGKNVVVTMMMMFFLGSILICFACNKPEEFPLPPDSQNKKASSGTKPKSTIVTTPTPEPTPTPQPSVTPAPLKSVKKIGPATEDKKLKKKGPKPKNK